jgi:hypothetical protein
MGGKGRPARKADNLTAICQLIFLKILQPRRLKTLWASTACYLYLLASGLCKVACSRKHGNKFSGSLKGVEFRCQLSNYQVLRI